MGLEELVTEDWRNPSNDNKEEIKTLALKYGIASKYTSFVGVDKKTRKSVLEPAMSSRQIQQEVPRGFGGYGPMVGAGVAPITPLACFAAAPATKRVARQERGVMRMRMRLSSAAMPMPLPPPMASGCSFGATANSLGPLRSSLKKPNRSESSKVYDCDVEEEEMEQYDMNMDSFWDSDQDDLDCAEQDDLEKLINLQLANGSFKFGKCFGHSEEEMKKSCPSGESFEVWITACAIAMLEKKYKNDKDLWELVVDKAKKFVKSNISGSLDDVLKKALILY